MLTHHDAEESNQPHFCTAMPTGFKLVIHLLPFIGAFHCRSPFIDVAPFITTTGDRRKQERIVIGVRVHLATVGRIRARRITRTDVLLHDGTAVLAPSTGSVVPVILHFQPLLANGDTFVGNGDIILVLFVPCPALVEVDERDLFLAMKYR